MLGRHKAAIDVYTDALKLSPTDWVLYDLLCFSITLKTNFFNIYQEITHNLGVCFMQLKNNEKSKAYFKEAINISKHELSFHMLAKVFIKENNIQAAIEALTKAVE